MKIPVSHGHLEATIREPDGAPRGAAVVCHPHPQHGGTMNTKAVFRTAQALNEVGIRALRFNFRGVGTSTGEWGGGVGEKDDVRAALDWMASDSPDLPLFLAGFSFGSRVGLEVASDDSRVRAMIGLGLPVDHYDFAFLADLDRPLLMIQGAGDEFGGEEKIRALHRKLGPKAELAVVPGSGHYFHDHFGELKSAIRDFFESGGGADALGGGDHASA